MSEAQPTWVKLFLVPQTDHLNSMPPSVIGLLTGETPGSYILNPMLEPTEDEETYDTMYASAGLNFVNKTYVWRNQILDYKPEVGVAGAKPPREMHDEDSGGLG